MFVAETLVPLLKELERSFRKAASDKRFVKKLDVLLKDYAGRPTPLYFAKHLSAKMGFRIYLKREDLLHTGAHKINNAIGQALLADFMGKKRIIAETGAGQHGVATATACALLGIECKIFMGKEDVRRQASNVQKMKLLGAELIAVESGKSTLKDAINEALRYWTQNALDTYYLFGSVAGPHPYPMIVRWFQNVIGKEAKKQILYKEKRLPHKVIACVGGGSNAIGIFSAFIDDSAVELIGVEAGGRGKSLNEHSASLSFGRPGVFQGTLSYVLDNDDGQIATAHSVAPGLDYPGVGPEHAYLKTSGRAQYISVNDREALNAFRILSKTEGIIPALESAHAVAALEKIKGNEADIIIVCLSGRGDKDINEAMRLMSNESL